MYPVMRDFYSACQVSTPIGGRNYFHYICLARFFPLPDHYLCLRSAVGFFLLLYDPNFCSSLSLPSPLSLYLCPKMSLSLLPWFTVCALGLHRLVVLRLTLLDAQLMDMFITRAFFYPNSTMCVSVYKGDASLVLTHALGKRTTSLRTLLITSACTLAKRTPSHHTRPLRGVICSARSSHMTLFNLR